MSEWISVDERLPHPNQSVLANRSNKGVSNFFFTSSGKWMQDGWGGIDDRIFNDITHWMPLPEPPTE